MKVIIIGGGLSGLATAFRVLERLGPNADLCVLEAGERFGGTIRTLHEDGWRVETGPNGFLDGKPGTLRLVRALGIEDRLLPADHSAKKRYLYIGGKLEMLPTSAARFLISPLLPFHARLRFLLEPLMSRGPEDETVAELGRRRIGRHAVERLLDPMVSGIFAGNVEELSVASAFPAVKALEREHGSLIRGMMARARERRRKEPAGGDEAGGPAGPGGHLTSLEGGMGELIETLVSALGPAVCAGADVASVSIKDGGLAVELTGGEVLEADAVVSAAPAYRAAGYLQSLSRGLSKELGSISYAPITVVAVGLREERLSRPLDGFGFLIPSRENERILGCLWDSSIYPGKRAPPGHVLTRTMIGGARRPDLALLSDDDLVPLVRDAHRRTMHLHWDEPDYLRIIRYERGIPQYPVGHGERVARLMEECKEIPGLFLTGNHLRGIGLNDCAAGAEAVADAVAAHFASKKG